MISKLLRDELRISQHNSRIGMCLAVSGDIVSTIGFAFALAWCEHAFSAATCICTVYSPDPSDIC